MKSGILVEQAANGIEMVSKPDAPPLVVRLISKVFMGVNAMARKKDHSLNRRIHNLVELKIPSISKSIKGVRTKDVVIDEATGVWVRIFSPTKKACQAEKLPVVIYYHGGGFAVLSADFILYDLFCRRMAKKAKCMVISVNYRRSPEYKFPIAHEDSFSILKWLQNSTLSAFGCNVDLSLCFLAGDSAGGNLVHYVACKAANESLTPVFLRGLVLIQPFFGAVERTNSELSLKNTPNISLEACDWYWKAYLPPGENRDHPICNVFGPQSRDLANVDLPPSLVVVGENDTLHDWDMHYVERMKKLGKDTRLVYYHSAFHVFHLFYPFHLSNKVLLDISSFIKLISSSSNNYKNL